MLWRVLELCGKMQDILRQLQSDYLNSFESLEFLLLLGYLSDIIDHFDSVNVKLQGPDVTIQFIVNK